MSKEIKTTNYVEASGKVIGIGRDAFGNKRLVLFIRGYQQRKAIYASFAISTNVQTEIKVGDRVNIKGHVVAYLYQNDLWRDRTNYIQYFVADEIEKDLNQIEKYFGVEGGFAYKDPFITICLAGKIIHIRENEKSNWVNFTIQVPNYRDRPNQVRLQYSKKMRVGQDVKIEEGDKVLIVAGMDSKRKEVNGETRTFEDFIIDDMIKAEGGFTVKRETEEGSSILGEMNLEQAEE